jgi:hypothetical protein
MYQGAWFSKNQVNNPNFFNLQVLPQNLEGGTAPADSGGPLFAVIGGQLVQIGVARVADSVIAEISVGSRASEDSVCLVQNTRSSVQNVRVNNRKQYRIVPAGTTRLGVDGK